MELYYQNYWERHGVRDWEDPVSLPFAVGIRDRERRAKFEEMLHEDGFQCVVWENGRGCMYVNFTLKRYGRNVKACGSTAINKIPMTEEEFMKRVYLPWKRDEHIRIALEHNYEVSARIELESWKRILERNTDTGRPDGFFTEYAEKKIRRYERYLERLNTL